MPPGATESIKVHTTLPKRPLPPNSERVAIKTARLVIRPFAQDDLQGIHVLRTQPEVMNFTSAARIDRDLDETQSKMDFFLSPNDARTFNCVICLSDTGEIIGTGGVHKMHFEFGWPEVGYILKREHWGKGYATEFMRGFLEAWWKLEREDVDIDVDALSVHVSEKAEGVPNVPELLLATVEANNLGSLRIMKKIGFRKTRTWTEPDARAGPKSKGMDVTLVDFVLGKQALEMSGR